jgi:hypothetical protein
LEPPFGTAVLEGNKAWRPQRRQGQESATLPVPEESQDSLGDAPAASRCEGRRVAPLVRRLNGAIQWACCVRHPLRAYEGQQGSIASCWLRRTGYCERQDRIPRNESVCPIGRLARSPNRGRARRLAERLNATRAGLVSSFLIENVMALIHFRDCGLASVSVHKMLSCTPSQMS